jgi:hypothetical protein
MLVLVGTLTLITTSCSEPVDFTQALDMVDVTTGWFDAGIVAGRNKIVPSVTLRFRNKTSTELERISVNALFRAADGRESELNNDVFVQRVEFQGNETPPITLRPDNGYTAEPPQSRADMLKHSQFRDMRVQVLVKQGSTQWTNMGWVDIERQLITR